MLYNLGQIRTQIAQYAGIINEFQTYDFSTTTLPSKAQVNNIINDSIREICGDFDYTFLEQTKSYPWYHTISGVQGVFLNASGSYLGSPVSGTTSIVPYPNDVLNYTWLAKNSVQNINSNFSGINCSFLNNGNPTEIIMGTSYSGMATYNNTWSGVGFTYQLDPDIDKFLVPGIIQESTGQSTVAGQGIAMKNLPYEDVIRNIPIGVVAASGTPSTFFELPGLNNNMFDSNGNQATGKVVQFFPFPMATYSGATFCVFYKKKHIDLINDTDVQQCIPDSWQNTIIYTTLAKLQQITNPEMYQSAMETATNRINQMRVWDSNQPSKVSAWRDAGYDVAAGYLYDNSTWTYLNDSPNWR